MSDDAKEWVTVRVPAEDREKAREYRPDGVTWGDCLVAGAERLNDRLDSDLPPRLVDVAEMDAEDLERLRSALETVEERTGRIEKRLEELQG